MHESCHSEKMMKNLKIRLYKNQKVMPEEEATIPFSVLHIAMHFLPAELKEVLEKEEIDILRCKELVNEKGLFGTLIEVETPEDRMAISVE